MVRLDYAHSLYAGLHARHQRSFEVDTIRIFKPRVMLWISEHAQRYKVRCSIKFKDTSLHPIFTGLTQASTVAQIPSVLLTLTY